MGGLSHSGGEISTSTGRQPVSRGQGTLVYILEELGSIQQNHNKEKQHSMLGSPIALSPNPATDFEEFFYLNLLFCKH